MQEQKMARVRSFAYGAFVVLGAGVMLGNVQARNDNVSPAQASKTKTKAVEYFVTQSSDGKTAYFWQLDVAQGKAGRGTDVVQADAVLLGVGEADKGGGLNQISLSSLSNFQSWVPAARSTARRF